MKYQSEREKMFGSLARALVKGDGTPRTAEGLVQDLINILGNTWEDGYEAGRKDGSSDHLASTRMVIDTAIRELTYRKNDIKELEALPPNKKSTK